MATSTTKGRGRPNQREELDDANSFLMGGDSVPSAAFITKGTQHEGEILDFGMRQQLDIDTRKPLFWENGDPKMQLVVTIQTDEEDPEIEDDDGRRRLYVKFKMKDAVAEALREADAKLEVGGWLGVKFVKQDKPTNRAKSGIKHFEAWYEKPDPAAAAQEFLDDGDEGDLRDEDEPDEAPPARGRGGRGRKSEPEPERPARGRGRRAAEDDSDDDGDDERPARGRGRQAASSGSGRGRGRQARQIRDDDEPPF